jgi:hypothetical protein
MPYNVNRTHAYAVKGRFIQKLYEFLADSSEQMKVAQYHIDHRMGALHEVGAFKVFAPTKWLMGQDGTRSDINGSETCCQNWPDPESYLSPVTHVE